MVHQLDIPKVVVESDSLVAVEALNGKTKLYGNCSHLITSIHQFCQSKFDVSFVFGSRNNNVCADWLAREALITHTDLSVLNSPPPALQGLLRANTASFA